MTDISLPIAFWGGIMSFFSPCVIPLIPAYIVYMTGNVNNEEHKFIAFTRTLGFIMGFSIIFISLGATASALGSYVLKNLSFFRIVSGIVIIVFGLYLLGVIKVDIFSFATRMKLPKTKGFIGSILMGMAFSVGWTPCVGAVLGSILFMAANQSTVTQGVILLSFYSLGLSIPFIIVSLLLDKFNENLLRFEKASLYISKIGGVILIIMGMLILFDKLTIINRFLS